MATAPSSNRTLNTTNQATISALFRVVNRYVGNLAPMPGVFPDYTAPIVRAGRKHEAAAITPYSGSIVFNPHGVKRHTAFREARLVTTPRFCLIPTETTSKRFAVHSRPIRRSVRATVAGT
jgi:hypothetical protein